MDQRRLKLMIDLRSRHPEAARALLGDMRGVAEACGEAALWELWANAAQLYIATVGLEAAQASKDCRRTTSSGLIPTA